MRRILNDIYKIFPKQIFQKCRTCESNNFIFTGYIYLVLDNLCTIVSSILDHCTLVNNIKEINWFTMAFMQIDWWLRYGMKFPFQDRHGYQCLCILIKTPNFQQYCILDIEFLFQWILSNTQISINITNCLWATNMIIEHCFWATKQEIKFVRVRGI